MVKKTKVIVTGNNSSPMSEGDYLKQQAGIGFGADKPSTANTVTVTQAATQPESKTEEKPDPVVEKLEQLLNRVAALETEKSESDTKTTQLEQEKTELEQKLEQQKTEAEGAVQELQAQHQQELEAVQSEKQEAEDRNARLEGALKLTGNQHPVTEAQASQVTEMPNVNTLTKISNKPQGLYKELQSIRDSADVFQKYTAEQALIETRDTSQLDRQMRYIRSDRKLWNQFLTDIEAYAKGNGLLRGPRAKTRDKNAATTGPNIDGGFLDTLSSIIRTTHRPQYIFRNFIDVQVDFNQGLGDAVKIYRAAFLPKPGDPDDFLLSGNGAYTPIDSTNQPVNTGVVSALLQEWGLGKNTNNPAVGIPTFTQAYSMIDLMQVMETRLGDNYYYFEDLKTRSLWNPTSRVVYNDGDQVTTTVGNADGSVTLQFLYNLFAYMRGLQIPTYRDGCYGLVLTDKAFAEFQNELIADQVWQATTQQDLDVLANMFSISTGQESGPADFAASYRGKYGNFHIFSTNAYATGAVGAAGAAGEGVQTETVAAGSATTRTNYAFGANSIGRGVGTPMEIRRDTNDDFGRIGRYIWRSEEGFVAMDVDPTGYNDQSAVPQQLRVIDVRTIG